MASTTGETWRPKRRGFSRSRGLRRGLADHLLRKKYKKPRDAGVEPSPIPPSPHMRIFMRRPSKAASFRFPDTEFFTHEPHGVRYTLLRVEGRRVLWALSTPVLRERCPRWLLQDDSSWKVVFPRYDSVPRMTEPMFRALRTIVGLLHGDPSPTPDRFDSPFVDALVHFRDRLNTGPVVNPWIQDLLRHLCRGGGRYIVDLPDWPLLMPLCARFRYQELFNLVGRRFVRKCEVGHRNLPHCRGITLCAVKPTGWPLENFLHQREDLVDEVLAFLRETATNFASMPKGHRKQSCATVIIRLLEQDYQSKTNDGRFTTTSLEQMVDVLRNAGDSDSPHATAIQVTLDQVATAASKTIDYRVSKMFFVMK